MIPRLFRVHQAADVAALWGRCNLTPPGAPTAKEIIAFADPKLFYTATLDNQIIGTVIGCEATGRISYLCIDEPFRNQGHGRVLLEFIREVLLGRGCKKLVLNSLADVTGFYEKAGWKAKQST